MSLHVGDYGVVSYEATVVQNKVPYPLDTTANVHILFRRPDLTELNVVGSFSSLNGTDGIVRYIFQQNDITVPGTWTAQVILTYSNGVVHTTEEAFYVKE